MEKIRILGPRERLEEVLDGLQDLGLLHLGRPEARGSLHELRASPSRRRQARHLRSALADAELCLERLGLAEAEPPPAGKSPTLPELADLAREARSARRALQAIDEERTALEEERASIARYDRYFSTFESLVPADFEWDHGRAYYLILRGGAPDEADRLRDALAEVIGAGFEMLTARVEGGGVAVVLLVPADRAPAVDRILGEVGVEELPILPGYGGRTLGEAIPEMRARLGEIDAALAAAAERRVALAGEKGAGLLRARAAFRDRLLEIEALDRAMETERAFVLEGWVPADSRERLLRGLASRFGSEIVAEVLSVEEWNGEEAPVELSNPRIFRPFEAITRMMPLPRYGSIDPTPFVGVFFPMFFGVILGDVAYGLVLAGLAAWLHHRSEPGTTLRSVSEIAGACAAFTIAFGLVYGEFLGDAGRRWLGLSPLFDREAALLPFLIFALALGVVHVVLGLVLGAISAYRAHLRQSVGRAVSAAMILLILVALLAATEVLPRAFFTPAIVALLAAFPILVVVEGVIAPVELLSTLGNVLSYARIMALGTASIVMAVVANQMVGAAGSVAVGVLFGLLFHLVNFALGVFGPAIHAVRLHYVEFFGKFYSPGGTEYRPFGHWRPDDGAGSASETTSETRTGRTAWRSSGSP